MSDKQLALFIARHVVSRASATETTLDPNHVKDERDGRLCLVPGVPGREALRTKFRCVFLNDEYLPLFDNGCEFTVGLGADATAEALGRLQRAARDLYETSRRASLLVNSYMWSLALRDDPGRKGEFSSRSFQCLPGLALFCNPCTEITSSFALEEALVHESLHSFLFFAESPEARLLENPRDRELSVASPWTGTLLDLHTGVHALLVWLVLENYWTLSKRRSKASERADFAERRLAFIGRGFDSPGFTPFIKLIREKITPAFRVVVDSMFNRRGAVECDCSPDPAMTRVGAT